MSVRSLPLSFINKVTNMSLLYLLEEKHFNRLTNEKVYALANQDSDFCEQWLVHSIRSQCEPIELMISLAYALNWKLDMLEQLSSLVPIDMCSHMSVQTEQSQLDAVTSLIPTIDIEQLLAHYRPLSNFVFGETTLKKVDEAGHVLFGASHLRTSMLDVIAKQFNNDLQNVTLFGSQGQGSQDQSIRNNSQYFASIPNSNLSLAVAERVTANAAGVNIAQAEPPVILRYRSEEYYQWHYDYIYPHTADIAAQINQFGQRIKTGIFYLNDDFSGGETQFKAPELSIVPLANHVLIFDNVNTEGQPLKQSVHRGASVKSGEKWIMTLWFRSKPFWLRSGLLQA